MSGPRVALVTGATTGIGRAIAFALGRDGYRIGAVARTRSRLEALATELAAAGIAAATHSADVAQPAEVAAAVDALRGELGPPNVLVNNAGISRTRPLAELTLEDWDATIATNLRGLFLMTRAVLPDMLRRRAGAVVNVASLAGRNGFAGGTAYCASKHGVLGFSRALMAEVRHEGIRVIAICPGSTDTAMIREIRGAPADGGRILHPDDVAAVVRDALRLPARALVSELDIRPAAP